ncbi:MAG: hypothetical protein ACJAYU_002942 [Bradymonadia bacterium]|jgi:hypothetical protein
MDRAVAPLLDQAREEHFLPLHVCAGAVEDDASSTPYRDVAMGAHLSAVHFG